MSSISRATEHRVLAAPVKEGLLSKQGGFFRAWRERWCVLRGNRIVYTQPDRVCSCGAACAQAHVVSQRTTERGHIDLNGCFAGDVRPSATEDILFESA
jgi:hypothetical protein